ncbi:hypothetical protein IEO21_05678 [Rhodonia placenta]|uniref:Uncharacterized protein n=1 Tax=Rhodonia placenta TaxID=104341 RepID=A0A8H7U1F1_9APHY|nr:hypothetical protein IEO21_05678 [Postia placenta]
MRLPFPRCSRTSAISIGSPLDQPISVSESRMMSRQMAPKGSISWSIIRGMGYVIRTRSPSILSIRRLLRSTS